MTIVFAIVLFSFLIFIHELGHFLTAKLSGIQVNEFSLFMGPAIFQKQVGETTYSIRCIPVGGYCAMEGEDEDSDNPRAFNSVAWWKRLIVLLAGAAMNFLAGLVLIAIVFAPSKYFAEPVISAFEEGNTISAPGGLQVGDRILEIDGERVYVQSDITMLFSLSSGDYHDLVVERDGKRVELTHFEMLRHEFANEDGSSSLRYGMTLGSFAEATLGNKVSYIWNTALDTVRMVRLSLQMLVTGQAGLKDMSGPVGIVQQMSQTAQESGSAQAAFYNLLYFGGFLAINLAVMNLLPLPALDGGRAVCLLITATVEAVTRKKVDPKYEGYFHAAGMVLLLALMAIVTFKDIFTIFRG